MKAERLHTHLPSRTYPYIQTTVQNRSVVHKLSQSTPPTDQVTCLPLQELAELADIGLLISWARPRLRSICGRWLRSPDMACICIKRSCTAYGVPESTKATRTNLRSKRCFNTRYVRVSWPRDEGVLTAMANKLVPYLESPCPKPMTSHGFSVLTHDEFDTGHGQTCYSVVV